MIKRFFALVCLITVLCSVTVCSRDITVMVDGNPLFCDAEPIIKNDRVLVPMRAIFEALSCDVSYKEEFDGNYVYAVRGNDLVAHKIGSDSIFVNGETVKLDVSSEILSDRAFVPLRAVSEALECSVLWDDKEYIVDVKSK